MLKSLGASLIALPYRLRLGAVGRRPRIIPPVLLSGAGRIRVGDDVRLEAFASLSASPGARIEIGAGCEVRAFCRLETDAGYIVIGSGCSVNPFCYLNGYGGITIGNDVRIASHSVVLSSSHQYDDPAASIQSQGVERRPTVIGDDVWIGSHTVILGGVHIGSHSIVGAGAVVTSNVEPFSVVAGVPARVIRKRNAD